MSPDIDAILDYSRKALCREHPALETDEERLAYLRGYFRGAEHREQFSSLAAEYEDLVFRIAAENGARFPRSVISYEDCVSIGYQAMLRKLHGSSPTRSGVAQAVRSAIVDAYRLKVGRKGSQHKPARIALAYASSPKRDEKGRDILPALAAASNESESISEVLAAIDMTPKERAICSYIAHGFNLRETGEAIGLSEGRICQVLKAVKKKHGERLATLLACEELVKL